MPGVEALSGPNSTCCAGCTLQMCRSIPKTEELKDTDICICRYALTYEDVRVHA